MLTGKLYKERGTLVDPYITFTPLFTKYITQSTTSFKYKYLYYTMPDNLILLNNHKMRGHDIKFIESTGNNHTAANPIFCCVVMVNGKVEGLASGRKTKKEAKAAAAALAVESLSLI